MKKIAEIIVNFMIKQNAISSDPEYVAFYTYGVEITISSILNIVLVLMIGIIAHAVIEALIFLFVFICVRTFTGGYHADTYFRCNFLMCVSFVVVILLANLLSEIINVFYIIGNSFLILTIVIGFCPIENVNKPIPLEKRLGLKIKGIICIILFSLLSILGLDDYPIYTSTVILTMLCIAILVIAAIIKERRKTI